MNLSCPTRAFRHPSPRSRRLTIGKRSTFVLFALLKLTAPARADDFAPGERRIWVGVEASLDLAITRPASDVCRFTNAGAPESDKYACTDPDGVADFPANQAAADGIAKGSGGNVGTGVTPGNVRVLAAVDYALTPNVLAGGRIGYVAYDYPGTHASAPLGPLHLEARATYLVGDHPLSTVGFAPVVLGGIGLAPFSAPVGVTVHEIGVPGDVPATAWAHGGPFFLTAGGGVRYALSERIAVTAAARASLALGGAAYVSFAPDLSLQMGF